MRAAVDEQSAIAPTALRESSEQVFGFRPVDRPAPERPELALLPHHGRDALEKIRVLASRRRRNMTWRPAKGPPSRSKGISGFGTRVTVMVKPTDGPCTFGDLASAVHASMASLTQAAAAFRTTISEVSRVWGKRDERRKFCGTSPALTSSPARSATHLCPTVPPRRRRPGPDPGPPRARLDSDDRALPRVHAEASVRGERPPASSLMPLDSLVGRADPGSALGDGSLPIIYPASLGHELDQNSINQPSR